MKRILNLSANESEDKSEEVEVIQLPYTNEELVLQFHGGSTSSDEKEQSDFSEFELINCNGRKNSERERKYPCKTRTTCKKRKDSNKSCSNKKARSGVEKEFSTEAEFP
ncbi:hypothetical protein J6590_003901 [Homalodisca vitripennis]|nr:hypothetical protein J6590_003901 [Homalodisca vitripennis]